MKREFEGKFSKPFTWLVNNYDFRFNVVTGLYEYRKLKKGKVVKGNDWKEYSDRVRSNILLEIFNDDLDLPDNKFNIFVESEINSPDYDPFQEYFDDVAEWEPGNKDYLKELCKTIETKNSKHLEETVLKFLVGTISCLLEPDAVNDVCLVFQSSTQGVGKSRWMRKLLPLQFQDQYLFEGAIDTKNKDHVIYLSQFWFIHLDELETLRGKNVGEIKSYITRQRISERNAYGRYKKSFVRRASFLGSVNEDKFLSDITGNRRWLVFETKKIDYQHNVDIDGLWSQVYYYYKQGFKHWFDTEEIKIINQINEEFREMSVEEEVILKYFGFPTEEDNSNGDFAYFSSSEVLMKLTEVSAAITNKMNTGKIGRALSKYHKVKKVSSGITKYYLEYSFSKKEEEVKNTEEVKTESDNTVSEGYYSDDDDIPF